MAKHVQNIDFKITKSYYILPHSQNKHIGQLSSKETMNASLLIFKGVMYPELFLISIFFTKQISIMCIYILKKTRIKKSLGGCVTPPNVQKLG